MSTKFKIIVGSLVGALAIQVAFIACLSSTLNSTLGLDGGIGSLVDAIVHALDSTTHDANAQSADAQAVDGGQTADAGLNVANETCSQTYSWTVTTNVQNPLGQTSTTATTAFTNTYAVHAYPGLTAAQLSQVRAIGHLTHQPPVVTYFYSVDAGPLSVDAGEPSIMFGSDGNIPG